MGNLLPLENLRGTLGVLKTSHTIPRSRGIKQRKLVLSIKPIKCPLPPYVCVIYKKTHKVLFKVDVFPFSLYYVPIWFHPQHRRKLNTYKMSMGTAHLCVGGIHVTGGIHVME